MNNEAAAKRIHREAIIIDGMNNARMSGEYFQSIIKAGITATTIPVSISATFRQTVDQLSGLLKLMDENKERVQVVRRADEIMEAKRQGKLGLILVLEDARQMEDDLDLLSVYREMGIRRMQVVYVMQNSLGCGKGERHDSGLTKLGVQAIERMEELGILIDLCHCAERTLQEALQVVRKPVVLSHSNVKGVYGHPNNLSDAQLEMIAKNGGVIGIASVPFYLAAKDPTLDQVVDHIDYVKKRIGLDYVGIGTAIFEGHPLSFYEQFKLPEDIYGKPPWPWPKGIETIVQFPNLTQKLLERGYSEGEMKKVLGENFLRVFRQVWA
ncbi:MAG: membrane dipeptidase [Chloroflexi bacterium]|nr:membrane dipeptidase [Chloroflexota bacterium]